MPVVIHGEGCHAITRFDPTPFQRLPKPPSVERYACPIRTMDRAVGASGYDLTRTMLSLRMIEDPHDTERKILHRAQTHARLP
jgi:hypothetical protein